MVTCVCQISHASQECVEQGRIQTKRHVLHYNCTCCGRRSLAIPSALSIRTPSLRSSRGSLPQAVCSVRAVSEDSDDSERHEADTYGAVSAECPLKVQACVLRSVLQGLRVVSVTRAPLVPTPSHHRLLHAECCGGATDVFHTAVAPTPMSQSVPSHSHSLALFKGPLTPLQGYRVCSPASVSDDGTEVYWLQGVLSSVRQ